MEKNEVDYITKNVAEQTKATLVFLVKIVKFQNMNLNLRIKFFIKASMLLGN